MTIEQLALILSPVVAVLVALGTIVFNIYDRRRFYALERAKLNLEREKLAQEMAKELVSGSKSFEKRAELFNVLMMHISEISAAFQRASLADDAPIDMADMERTLSDHLSEILTLVRSNQVLTTPELHSIFTQGYFDGVTQSLTRLKEADAENLDTMQRRELAKNVYVRVKSLGDDTKDQLREHLNQYILGLAKVGSGN